MGRAASHDMMANTRKDLNMQKETIQADAELKLKSKSQWTERNGRLVRTPDGARRLTTVAHLTGLLLARSGDSTRSPSVHRSEQHTTNQQDACMNAIARYIRFYSSASVN
jgi:hypothetical protein